MDGPAVGGVDFTIRADDGAGGFVDLDVSLTSAVTVQDILDAINAHPLNNTGGIAIQAQLTAGNVFRLTDLNGRPITVRSTTGSEAAEFLGLVAPGGVEAIDPTGVLTGAEIHFPDSGSVFTTLSRLRDAIAAGDINGMERAIALIDEDISRATFAQAEVGSREQALVIASRNLEDEDVQLQSALSNEIEVDLVEAISNLTARQVSLQASLQAMANILQLSLLNYL
jgi:flagellin-like hook-associated protein FlgL